jgi:hypothetical protein
VIDIGLRRELFADGYLVERLSGGAVLRLHHPVRREVAIRHDEPWEGNGTGWHSIFKDGDRYRMYYMVQDLAIIRDNGKLRTRANLHDPKFLCYAESDDGIRWRKPNLGLFEFQGSKNNNIVYFNPRRAEGGQASEVALFRDENPNAAPDARYKAFFRTGREAKTPGIIPYKSADGIHWVPMSDQAVITAGNFDSQNLGFWDAERGEYRAYWRYWTGEDGDSSTKGFRAIRTATSKDFLHWENVADLVYAGSPPTHLYTNQIKPYHRAPHIVVGFPVRYLERGWSDSMRALPDGEHRKMRAEYNDRFGTGLSETLIMFSRDRVNFKRWDEAFLRPGPEHSGNWNYGSQYAAWHLLETRSDVDGEAAELSLYAVDGHWVGNSASLFRYTLRLDGFVSVNAPMTGGEVITKPIVFNGNELSINFSTSAAGSVQVELQDLDGNAIPAYSREDCSAIFGDSVDRVVTWTQGSNLQRIRNMPVRICFILRDADLFSFKIGERAIQGIPVE